MRDYDPTLGRYIQAGPLGLVDGASVYGYALQNPGRYTDPKGLSIGIPDIPNLPGNDFGGLLHCADYDNDVECRELWEFIAKEYDGILSRPFNFGTASAYNALAEYYNEHCVHEGSDRLRAPLIPLIGPRGPRQDGDPQLQPDPNDDRNESAPNEDRPWWKNIPPVPPIGVPGGRPRSRPPGGSGTTMPPLRPVLVND